MLVDDVFKSKSKSPISCGISVSKVVILLYINYKIRINEMSIIKEMSLKKTATIGDFDEDDNIYFDSKDKKMLSTKNIGKTIDLFKNSNYDFVFYYFPKGKLSAENQQYGVCQSTNTLITVMPGIGQENAETIMQNDKSAITLIFAGNLSSDKHPLTGWIQAHRAIHSIAFSKDYTLDLWNRVMQRDLISLLTCYNCFDMETNELVTLDKHGNMLVPQTDEIDSIPYDSDFVEWMVNSIGSMLSSKQHKLFDRPSEFFMECGAQYIIQNKITLENRLPKTLTIRGYLDSYRCKLNEDKVEAKLKQLEKRWNKMFDTLLKHSVGKVFLM